MRVIFSFDRNRPFENTRNLTPDELADRYARVLSTALRDHYPEHQIEVHPVEQTTGEVVFVPDDVLTNGERRELALDIRRAAHRLADLMFTERLSASGMR